MKKRVRVLGLLLVIIPLIAGASLGVVASAPPGNVALAAGEGEGAATIAPSSVTAGSTGNTMTITYTAGATAWSSGDLEVTIPTGWSAPSITATGPGYVTISQGTVSVLGQVITISGITIAAGGTVSVVYGSKAGGGPGATAQATAGTAIFTVRSDPDGSLVDNPVTPIVTSPSVTVSPAAPSSFRVVTSGAGSEVAGTAFSVSLTALDADGGSLTSYSGAKTISFTSTATASPNATAPTIPATESISFNDGVGTSSTGFILINAGETPTITATEGTISGTSAAITVKPAANDHYTVVSASYTQKAGVAFTVTVTAYDQYGNVVTTDSTTAVTMSSNSATLAFDGNANDTFGEAGDNIKSLITGTFSISAKDTSPGTEVTITATDANGKTGTSAAYSMPIISPVTEAVGTAESWVDTPDGRVILHFPAGTFTSTATVSIDAPPTHPEAPEGYRLGETCFAITATAALQKPMDICVRYSDADLNAADGDAGRLKLAAYNEETEKWELLPTDIDQRTRTACARVSHLTTFAILAGVGGGGGFFSAAWWGVWWHSAPVGMGLFILLLLAVWLWMRYRYY